MAFKVCPYCRESIWEGAITCPDCGQFLGNKDSEDGGPGPDAWLPDEGIAESEGERTPAPRWLAWRNAPTLRNPCTQRAVEIGFIMGTGLTFLAGFASLFIGANIAGAIVFMVASPLIGIFAGLALGAGVESLQIIWHSLAGPPAHLPSPTQLHGTDKLTSTYRDQPCTEIIARSTHLNSLDESSPETTGKPASPVAEAEVKPPVKDEEGSAPLPELAERRIVWRTLMVSAAAGAALRWLLPEEASLWSPLLGSACLGLPLGFLVAALIVRGHRRRTHALRRSRKHR